MDNNKYYYNAYGQFGNTSPTQCSLCALQNNKQLLSKHTVNLSPMVVSVQDGSLHMQFLIFRLLHYNMFFMKDPFSKVYNPFSKVLNLIARLAD